MKRKMFLVVAFFLATSMVSLFGQVHIGDNTDPHQGAILDLTNNSSKGLKLPVVALQNAEYLQVGDAVTAAHDTDMDAMGMTVYNTNKSALDGEGVYVWDGQRWYSLYAQDKGGVEIPAPVCSQVNVPSLVFAPYNLGADAAKIDGIAAANNISKTKAYIKCSVEDWDAVLGDLYQWGRITDGHEKRSSQSVHVSNLNASTDYDASTGQVTHATYKKYFIVTSNNPYNWYQTSLGSPLGSTLWGNSVKIDTYTDPSGLLFNSHYYQSTAWQISFNNPCPAGFRVPTQDEWERIIDYDCKPNAWPIQDVDISASENSYVLANRGLTWVRVKDGCAISIPWLSGDKAGWAIYETSVWDAAGQNYKGGQTALYLSGAPEPLLFLPAAGRREGANVSFPEQGCYWSSSIYSTLPSSETSHVLSFTPTKVSAAARPRSDGLSVRCVAK
ncbi:MAG: fibrobacter succinogenes major paralogous domain-containing protein [Dysgonamonadaceae bacterium]|jgi:hypothetical protein|nr:fibrobacter succinogenes major paralogous domain-containing protein [Dysgonamonadaceae bacterium]